MRKCFTKCSWSFTLALLAVAGGAGSASAEERAVVQVAGPYAPPPGDRRDEPPPQEPSRSVLVLHVGPEVATTGRGLGPGLGVAADFGRGTMGFRLDAAWLRGEPSPAGGSSSPIAGGLAQYGGEFTLDFAHRGPLHPILGVGFAFVHADTGHGAGDLGAGTARAALEYALALDDADVRFAAGVLGALPGPADSAVSDLRGWALLGASIGIGF